MSVVGIRGVVTLCMVCKCGGGCMVGGWVW